MVTFLMLGYSEKVNRLLAVVFLDFVVLGSRLSLRGNILNVDRHSNDNDFMDCYKSAAYDGLLCDLLFTFL